MRKPRRAKPGGATRFATLSREAAPRDCGGSPAWEKPTPERDCPELWRSTRAGTTAGVGTAPDGARQDTGATTVARREVGVRRRLPAHLQNESLLPVLANGSELSCEPQRRRRSPEAPEFDAT